MGIQFPPYCFPLPTVLSYGSSDLMKITWLLLAWLIIVVIFTCGYSISRILYSGKKYY